MASFSESCCGCLYVLDQDNSRVKVLDKSSKLVIRSIPLDFGSIESKKKLQPMGLFVHDTHVFITVAHTVMVFDLMTGALVRKIGSGEGWGAGKLQYPSAVVIHAPVGAPPEEHMLLVSDYLNHRICIFNLVSGEFIRNVTGLRLPRDFVLWTPSADPAISTCSTQIFASDFYQHRICVIDMETGALIRSIGKGIGEASGQLRGPAGLAIHRPVDRGDDEAILVVADSQNCRIQVFQVLSGMFLRVIGLGFLESIRCTAVLAFSDGHSEVVVSETVGHCLQVFDLDSGSHIATVGSGPGRGEDQFDSPLNLFSCGVSQSEAYVLK